MFKMILFVFLCFFFVSAQENNRTKCEELFIPFKTWCPGIPICDFELKRKLKLFNESCQYLPSFTEKANHSDYYYIYAIRGRKCLSFVNDCCEKNLTRDESCTLDPPSPDIKYHVVVYSNIIGFCNRPLAEKEKVKSHDIDIDRPRKYCHFEVDPEDVPRKDSRVFVEGVTNMKYKKPEAESQEADATGMSCPTTDPKRIEPNASVIVKNSKEISCSDIQTTDGSHGFLKNKMAEANSTAHCAYVHSMKQIDCLVPEHVIQDTHFLAYILPPLIFMFIIVLILVYCCFRQSLQNILKSLLCQDDISNEKLGKILKIGSDDVEIATEFIPNVKRNEEKPDEIFSGTVLLLQRTAPVKDNNESTNVLHSNGQEEEENDDSHVSEHDSYLEKIQDLTKFSGSSAADSGITSNGSRGSEISSFSKDGDRKFKDGKKIAIPDNISDCCFEEDEIVVHDEYTNNLEMICGSHQQQRQSASSADTGCETSYSTDAE